MSKQRPPIDFGKLTSKDFSLINRLDRQQEDMVRKLYKYQRVLVNARAGSGKTAVLTQAMKVLLDRKYIDEITYIVFPVQEDKLGFLPGELPEKIRNYAIPFWDALRKAGVNPDSSDMVLSNMCNPEYKGSFKVLPHTFVRGQSYSRTGAIVDEAQNGTKDELQKTFTRFEEDCYIGIAGHVGQIDISHSGFADYINFFKKVRDLGYYKDIAFAELTENYRGGFSLISDMINASDNELEEFYRDRIEGNKNQAVG